MTVTWINVWLIRNNARSRGLRRPCQLVFGFKCEVRA